MVDSVFIKTFHVPEEYGSMCFLNIRDGEQNYQWNCQSYSDAAITVSHSFGEYPKMYIRNETEGDKLLISELRLCGATFDTYKNGDFEKYEKRLSRMNDKIDAYIDVGMGFEKKSLLCVCVYADGEIKHFKSNNVLVLAYKIKADYPDGLYNTYIDPRGISATLVDCLEEIDYKVIKIEAKETVDLDKLEEELEDKMKIET